MLDSPESHGVSFHESTIEIKEKSVDKTKYKSVAVPVETYKKLQKLAEDSDRSVGRQIAHMVKTYEPKKAA